MPYVEEPAARLNIGVTLIQVVEPAYRYYEGADDFSSVPLTEKEMNSIKARARRYLKKVAGIIEQKGIPVKVRVAEGNSAETIIRVATGINADVLVLPTRGRSGISRWVFGSVMDDIVNAGNIPVLLVRVPE